MPVRNMPLLASPFAALCFPAHQCLIIILSGYRPTFYGSDPLTVDSHPTELLVEIEF